MLNKFSRVYSLLCLPENVSVPLEPDFLPGVPMLD